MLMTFPSFYLRSTDHFISSIDLPVDKNGKPGLFNGNLSLLPGCPHLKRCFAKNITQGPSQQQQQQQQNTNIMRIVTNVISTCLGVAASPIALAVATVAIADSIASLGQEYSPVKMMRLPTNNYSEPFATCEPIEAGEPSQ